MPHPFHAAEPRFLAAGAFVALATAAAWRLRRAAPAFAAAWGAYLLILAPTAGFLKIGSHLMADRYTYLSMLGFAGLAAAGARRALAKAPRSSAAAAALVVAALSASAWSVQGDWRDSDRLWSRMASDPGNAPARKILARIRLKQGRPADAEALLREAVALDPTDGGMKNDLANLLEDSGRHAEAVELYRAAIRLEPEHAVARFNLALSLLHLGRKKEAAAALREELALIRRARRPEDPLRAELSLDPDEKRTSALLRSIAPGEAAR